MENREVFDKTLLKESLFVDWHLLDGLNHDCEYSHEPLGAATESYERAPLLKTAWRLLSWNMPEYVFHFYGGEPTIHPFFPDLFGAIARSGRNVRIILDTNGLRGAKYFTELLALAAPGGVVVNVEVHPHCMELESLLYVVAAIAQQRQLCRLVVNCVPSCAEKAKLICEKLMLFRKTLPFLFELRFPLGGRFSWASDVEASFRNITQPALCWPDWAEICNGPALPLLSGDWACLGVNSCHVKKDGTLTLGLLKDDLPLAALIMPHPAMLPGLPPPPSFPEECSAAAYLREHRQMAVRRLIEAPLARWPLNAEIVREQRLLSAVKHLPANGRREGKIAACPDLLAKNLESILRAYEILTDEADKVVFLGRLKAQLLGDPSYLQDRSDVQEEIEGKTNACGEQREILHFGAVAGGEGLRDFFWQALWSQSPVEIVLPIDGTWVDVLLQAHAALSGYEIHMRQAGLDTVIYGESPVGPKEFLALRCQQGHPPLSIVLAASGDPTDLTTSLESILALPDYQAIVILDENSLPLSDMVNGYVRRSDWRIRPIFTNTCFTAPEAWSLGLELAQGDYVCFLQCGDAIVGDVLFHVLRNMAAYEADIVMEMVDTSAGVLESDSPLALILDGTASLENITDKIYRTSILTSHATAPQKFLNLITDGGLNFAAFYFAHKALAIPQKITQGPNRLVNGTNFIGWLNTVSHFCVAYKIRTVDSDIGAWLAATFMQSPRDVALSIQSHKREGMVGFPLEDFALRVLFGNSGSAGMICEGICRSMDIAVAPQVAGTAACLCSPVGSCAPEPLLTVVVFVDRDSSSHALEEMLIPECPEAEWLLIDNTAQGRMAVELAYLADVHANVRVGTMDPPQAHPATCANCGLDLARGSYVIFLNGGDHTAPDLIRNSLHIVSGGGDNIFAFGSRLKPGSYNCGQFLEGSFESGEDIFSCAIIYDRHFLMANGLMFEAGAPEWKTDFLLRALLKSGITLVQGRAFLDVVKRRPFQLHPDCRYECLAVYDDILRGSAEWAEIARRNLETWLGQNLMQTWLAQQHYGLRMAAAPMPHRVVSLLWRTLFAKYAEAVLA